MVKTVENIEEVIMVVERERELLVEGGLLAGEDDGQESVVLIVQFWKRISQIIMETK